MGIDAKRARPIKENSVGKTKIRLEVFPANCRTYQQRRQFVSVQQLVEAIANVFMINRLELAYPECHMTGDFCHVWIGIHRDGSHRALEVITDFLDDVAIQTQMDVEFIFKLDDRPRQGRHPINGVKHPGA